MTWLDVRHPTFGQRYPHGAVVTDARGRRLEQVVACDAETGEVVMVDMGRLVTPQRRLGVALRHILPGGWDGLLRGADIPLKRGLWPVPKTAAEER